MNYNFTNIPGYNPLRYDPQMPYAKLPGLAQIGQGPNIQAPSYIDPNQNNGSQYQVKPSWQFGLNYNQIAFSNAVQGVGAFLRSNNQRKDFNSYNRAQQNPLSQISENPNNTDQSMYGMRQYRMGGMKRYDEGGDPRALPTGKPTTADSLALYNNAKQVAAYYKNNPKYQEHGETGNYFDTNVKDFDWNNRKGYDKLEERMREKTYPVTNGTGGKENPNFTMNDYRKDINNNQYYQREFSNGILDLRSPMSLYDKRIIPQYAKMYKNISSNDELAGDEVELYQYDPIAVKPWNMLTDKERQQRIQKYGNPNPQSNSIPPTFKPPIDLKRSQVQDIIPTDKNINIQSPNSGSNVSASQSKTGFSYGYRNENDPSKQSTLYFPDQASWKEFTDKNGYQNRTVSGDNKTAQATGYLQKRGGKIMEGGGRFDDFDDFGEEDFEDLKDELDKYFKDKGLPNPDQGQKEDDDQDKEQPQQEEQDQPRQSNAMDFLLSQQQEEPEDNTETSDKDIADQLAGLAPIPQPSQQGQSPDHPDLEAFKNGIARVENANYTEGNKNSSAFGKYQFTAPTREAVRQQFFSTIGKKDFEDAYKADPKFQEKVMDAYGSHLLNTFQDPHKAATAFFLGEGKANMYNQPNYRPTPNNLTVGKYLQNFDQGYNKRQGGHIGNSPGSVTTGFDRPYNFKMEDGGDPSQGGPGQPPNKATTADSLAVYNNAKQVAAYYKNNPSYKNFSKVSTSGHSMDEIDAVNYLAYKRLEGSYNFNNTTTTENGERMVKPDQYKKDINNNQYYQREVQNAILDMRAPMTLFDDRIAPQNEMGYKNIDSKSPLYGDVVDLYQYDPIAVKPFNMLTPDEKKIRIQKYGDPTKGSSIQGSTPQPPNKPVFIPPPMSRTQVQSPKSLQNPYGPIQGSPMNMGQLAGQDQTPFSFTGRDDQGQQTTRYFKDLDSWKAATEMMGYRDRTITNNGKQGNATGYQFKEGGEYDLSNSQIAQLKKLGYQIDIIK